MKSKVDILYELFGGQFEYLLNTYKLSPTIIPNILLWIFTYFYIVRKHMKGTKYSLKGKIILGITVYVTILSVILQIVIFARY